MDMGGKAINTEKDFLAVICSFSHFLHKSSVKLISVTIDSSAKSLKELFFWFLFSRKFILCLIPLSRFLIRSNFEFNLLEWFDQRRRNSVKSRSEVFHLSLDWISICLSDLKCQVGISCPPSSPDSAFLSKSIRSFYTKSPINQKSIINTKWKIAYFRQI